MGQGGVAVHGDEDTGGKRVIGVKMRMNETDVGEEEESLLVLVLSNSRICQTNGSTMEMHRINRTCSG